MTVEVASSVGASRACSVVAIAVALLAMPSANAQTSQSELDALRQQIEEQRKALEAQQRIMNEQQRALDRLQSEQQRALDRLEKQLGSQEGALPRQEGATSAIPVLGKTQIEIYGTLYPLVENISASGATVPAPGDRPNQLPASAYTGTNQGARNRTTLGTTNIGFRGAIPLGDAYEAYWQLESGAAINGDSATIGGTNTFGLRNSSVGLRGSFGTVFFGNWDTPYKWASIFTTPLRGGQNFDYNGLIGNPGFGVFGTTTQSGRVNGKADAAFDRRQGYSIQYWTPTWNGLSARLDYGLDAGKSGSTAVPVISPALYSIAVSYENGPFVARYAYEQHDDYFGMSQIGGAAPSATNTSSKDTGSKIVLSYTFPTDTTVSGTYEWLRYWNDDGTAATDVGSYRRNGYYFTLQQKFGAHKVWGSYGSTSNGSCSTVGGASCSTSGLGASEWVGGYVFSMNKYVDLYAVYYDINNKSSGTYQPVSALNVPVNTTPAPGLNIRSFGGGILVSF